MPLETTRNLTPGGNVQRTFVAVVSVLLAASTVATVAWRSSMPMMDDMPMPDGASMSMAWMPMPGQGWPAAMISFTGMWAVMMVAMMLPSLIPPLWRYRRRIERAGDARADRHAMCAGLGYFLVWVVFGAAAYPVIAALAAVAMRVQAMARMLPLALGAVVLLAGLSQFSAWKTRSLACCRELPYGGIAWRDGLHHGLHCVGCCAGLTLAWLAVGVMDLRAMALVTLAITAERLAPTRVPMARIVGVLVALWGWLLLARAAGLA